MAWVNSITRPLWRLAGRNSIEAFFGKIDKEPIYPTRTDGKICFATVVTIIRCPIFYHAHRLLFRRVGGKKRNQGYMFPYMAKEFG